MRRNILFFNLLFVSVLLLWACEKSDESPVLTKVEPSELNYLPINIIELQNPNEGASPLLFTITWTATTYFLDNSASPWPVGPVSYSLEMDKEGNDFQNAQVLAVTNSLFADIITEELNGLLLNEFSAKALEAANYELRVVATYGEENPNNAVVSANILPVTISPYFPPKTIEPIYIIGDLPEDEVLGETSFMMYRNSSSADDYAYTYTGRFDEGTKFKLSPMSELASNNFYYAGENGALLFGESDGNDFLIAEEGYYTLNINVKDMTWDISAFDASSAAEWPVVNFVGAFSEWGESNEPDMKASAYDPHQWSLDVELSTIEYGVKFRANHSWDNTWCPAAPTDVPYGLADFNPAGHDNNLTLDEQGTGTYHVRLNDLTGHYVVMKK